MSVFFTVLPQLVRMCYLREKGFEVLGGGEQVLYRAPDGGVIGNWELIHTASYEAFKRGFRDGFEGREPAAVVDPELGADYRSGFTHGRRERRRRAM